MGLGMPGVTQTSFQTATCATQPVIQNRKNHAVLHPYRFMAFWHHHGPCTLAKDPSSGIGRWKLSGQSSRC